jgi:hypothetical protein
MLKSSDSPVVKADIKNKHLNSGSLTVQVTVNVGVEINDCQVAWGDQIGRIVLRTN